MNWALTISDNWIKIYPERKGWPDLKPKNPNPHVASFHTCFVTLWHPFCIGQYRSNGLGSIRQAKIVFNRCKKIVLIQAGAFRIGDTAGTLDNIVACKLHRPGSVGFVSKSGGMSNEMYNVLSRTSDGLYEGRHGKISEFYIFYMFCQ